MNLKHYKKHDNITSNIVRKHIKTIEKAPRFFLAKTMPSQPKDYKDFCMKKIQSPFLNYTKKKRYNKTYFILKIC